MNLKSPAGLAIFMKMASRADVVVEGFRPGTADRLGIGYEAVKTANPRIVYCSISGYGQDGPERDRAGHDLNYIARAGILGLCGRPGGAPAIPPVQIADLSSGCSRHWVSRPPFGRASEREKDAIWISG